MSIKKIDYHETEKRYIGSSDIATEIVIGSHYRKVASFSHWLKIYDDNELVTEYSASEINVYRAGEYGCVIQLLD